MELQLCNFNSGSHVCFFICFLCDGYMFFFVMVICFFVMMICYVFFVMIMFFV